MKLLESKYKASECWETWRVITDDELNLGIGEHGLRKMKERMLDRLWDSYDGDIKNLPFSGESEDWELYVMAGGECGTIILQLVENPRCARCAA